MNSRYLNTCTSTFEDDALKMIAENAGAIISHHRSVRSNSPVSTRNLGIIVDSGASEHVAHDISLLANVHDVEPTMLYLPDAPK